MKKLLLRFQPKVGWYLKREFDIRTRLPEIFASREAAVKWCKKNKYEFI